MQRIRRLGAAAAAAVLALSGSVAAESSTVAVSDGSSTSSTEQPAEASTTSTPALRHGQSKEKAFDDFVQRYGKRYASPEERARHFAAFCKNYDIIQERNAAGHGYELGITEFADMTLDEFSATYGSGMIEVNLSSMWGDVPKLEALPPLQSQLPVSLDWRDEGAVGKVLNQGQCGACWAFAAAGAIEGAWKIAGGGLLTLSTQQFTDCAGGKWGNHGCEGGNPALAFMYARYNDLCTYGSYRYEAVEGTCRQSNCAVGVPAGGVRGYKAVAPDDEQALMAAVTTGPVAVAIEADAMVFQLYKGGIIKSPDCGTKIDHGVLLVGYGTEKGTDYWLIKNSWGPLWGDGGYVRLARGVTGAGECGVLTMSSYPVIDTAKVVPGSIDIDPGDTAAVAFVGVFGCIFLCCCYTQCCKGRTPQRQPLLYSQPAQPAATGNQSRFVPSPWAQPQAQQLQAQQAFAQPQMGQVIAVTPQPGAQAQAATQQTPQVQMGNSAGSRLLRG
eukprot:TRINITY_DN97653_c0_g1_i1.p1 TRINITY_DN97653_c0_g1~~TRINITY_DN97653_c0_g1_i1.p1  ORF type:complete len:519 (+),score=120.88 TRINITY_DN97653_c0_g1_i1:59-1558(+)